MLQNLWQSFVARSLAGFGRGSKAKFRRRSPGTLLRSEALEQRLVLSAFSVTNTNDSGVGSFRQAILDANATAGADTISFAIPGSGLRTIQPLSALPTITDSVVIDGYTQAGSSANTLAVGNNAVLNIELNGASAGASTTGLTITAGNSTVRGLVINRFTNRGILISGTSAVNNSVTGNFIGTNAAGMLALGNTSDGVRISNANGNWIGTNGDGVNDLAERNVISGSVSGNGVVIVTNATQNVVAGNYIGTNAAGTAALANTHGVLIFSGAHGNRVGTNGDGTSDAREQNIIAGNRQDGIFLSAVNQTVMAGNVIGLAADGTSAMGNGLRGIEIAGGTSNRVGTDGNGVGDLQERNVISANVLDGVVTYGTTATLNLIAGNFIGTDITGTLDRGNSGSGVAFTASANNNVVGGTTAVLRNVISGNNTHGVYLTDSATASNVVLGNYIGTDVTGSVDLGNSSSGVRINSSSNNTIGGTAAGSRNVISGNDLDGITFTTFNGATATGNLIQGNFIGTDASGMADLGNSSRGVHIGGSASGNTIGGTTAGARNVISGNSTDGVYISGAATGNVAMGNYIGTDVTGQSDLGNDIFGVRIENSSGNTIGGTAAGAGNLISGNSGATKPDGAGLAIIASTGSTAANNVVQGNLIGTDATGTVALGNSNRGGVSLENAGNNLIGGTAPGARNVISGNNRLTSGAFSNGHGVLIGGATANNNVIAGNYIGTDMTGTVDLGNAGAGVLITARNNTIGGNVVAARNIISGNDSAGVLISGSSVTANEVIGNFIGTDVSGTTAIANLHGVHVTQSAHGNRIGTNGDGVLDSAEGNVISGNQQNGIFLVSVNNSVVAGNFIGLSANGSAIVANGLRGIEVSGTSNRIGTDSNGVGDANERNVISGNTRAGIIVTGTAAIGTLVAGNYIGTDATGTVDLGNVSDGIQVAFGAINTTIGGTSAGAGNVISGNNSDGIEISGTSSATLVVGNFIGTTAAGTGDLGNSLNGVRIDSATNNTIGGVAAGARNIISGNDAAGVAITGSSAVGNAVRGNSIFANSGLGIDLDATGITPNDLSDGDSGPNLKQNFPGIASAQTGATTTVSGSLNSTANTTFTLDFYASTVADPSGHGEGERYLGSATVVTDGNGNANFAVVLTASTTATESVSVTATAPNGNTSEFAGHLPTANAGGPYAVAEGGSVALNGLLSSDPDTSNSLSYQWDLDGDNVFGETGAGATRGNEVGATPTFSAVNLDGPSFVSVTLRVTDTSGLRDEDTINITIINASPTANADIGATDEDSLLTVAAPGVLSNDTDPANTSDPLTVDSFATPSAQGAIVVVNSDGSYSYDPRTSAILQSLAVGQSVTDTLSYEITDGDGGSSTGTVNVTVSGVNDVPTVASSSSSVTVNEATTAANSGTFADVDSTDSVTLLASVGTVTWTGTNNGSWNWSFDTSDGPNQSEMVTITATDSQGAVATTTFALVVNNVAPTATDNAYSTNQGTAVSGNVISDALADSDPAGANDPLTVTSITQPANGSVTVSANGSFTYTPATTFSGTDSFSYSISDGDGGSATAFVTITVAPPAAGSITTVIDTCEGGTALLINGTSVDDHIVVELGDSAGTLRININGTITTVITPSGRLIVLGDAGDDNIQIAGSVMNTVWAYGDAGHDRIFGGGGASLLFGGDGNDQLTGGSGRDVLIGGQGADKLIGNSNDDVLIAGYTAKDHRSISGVEEFWCQVMEEWNSSNSFADRLANLRGADTQKANANNGVSYLLPVVMDDTSADEIDMLQGSSGNDWFIYRAGEDKVVGQLEAAN